MLFPVLCAYLTLLRFEVFLGRKNFAGLYAAVRRRPLRRKKSEESTIQRVCSDVDHACIWYWKQVLCLQRSAATACLLKDHGIPAQLVIGVQRMPFKAHAWVEVEGLVVNDVTYTSAMYSVLDRC
jgi:hypothetical protein